MDTKQIEVPSVEKIYGRQIPCRIYPLWDWPFPLPNYKNYIVWSNDIEKMAFHFTWLIQILINPWVQCIDQSEQDEKLMTFQSDRVNNIWFALFAVFVSYLCIWLFIASFTSNIIVLVFGAFNFDHSKCKTRVLLSSLVSRMVECFTLCPNKHPFWSSSKHYQFILHALFKFIM